MKDDRLFYAFCGCFALMFLLMMHVAQQKRINELQVEIDELRIIVDQKFLPALILDKEIFSIR